MPIWIIEEDEVILKVMLLWSRMKDSIVIIIQTQNILVIVILVPLYWIPRQCDGSSPHPTYYKSQKLRDHGKDPMILPWAVPRSLNYATN